MKEISVLLIVILCVSFVHCANILGIWSNGEKTHHLLGEVLFKELARRGHNVTMTSAFPLEEPYPNYTDIYIRGLKETDNFRPNIFLESYQHVSKILDNMFRKTRIQTEITFSALNINSLLEDGPKFDVIITDWFLNFGIFYYGKLLNVPIIALAYQGADNVATILTGNPVEPSYIPVVGMDYPPRMDLIQRICNGILYGVTNLLGRRHVRYHQSLIRRYFNDTMSRREMINRLAIVLSNSHYSFEWPRPYVPNIIPIGGFHILPPKKLPRVYKNFLDSAPRGAIYCSLGSDSRKPTLSTKALEVIMKVFANMFYKVIFEWNHERIKNKPMNVLICKSCPHNDILDHDNVKLFISHGGLLSTIEAIHHAVPILGIPFYEDQRINMASAVRKGYAVHLDLDSLNEEMFAYAIRDLLFDPSYREKVEKLSLLLRDQPISPMDTAVFWIEHVIRHKSGFHLKNLGNFIPWYQYYMLDVIIVLSLVANLILLIFFIFIRDFVVLCRPSNIFIFIILFLLNVYVFQTHLCLYRFMSSIFGGLNEEYEMDE